MRDPSGMTPDARRAAMAALIARSGFGLSTVAAMVYVSEATVRSWRRATNPTAPDRAAVELFALKTGQPVP